MREIDATLSGAAMPYVSRWTRHCLAVEHAESMLALDEALSSLSKIDPRKGRVVELRYFGGLSAEETAEVLQISPETVLRDWKMAKTWLFRELTSMRIPSPRDDGPSKVPTPSKTG